MEINSLIVKLLLNNEKVAIKDLGIFKKELQAAYIHPVSNVVSPAMYVLKFEQNQNQKDEIMVAELANSTGMSMEEANTQIQNFINEIFSELKAGKKYTLKNIGHLVYKQGNSIVFEQDTQFNFFTNNFGLKSVIIEPIKRIETSAPVYPSKPKPIEKKKSYKWIVYASIAAVFVVLAGLAYWQKDYIISVVSPKKVEIVKVDSAAIKQEMETRVVAEQQNQNLDSAMTAEESLDNQALEAENNPAQYSVVENNNPYLLIAGCFKSENNAQKYVDELINKGFTAMVVGKTSGMSRVCFGTYTTKEEANQALKVVSQKGFKGAWVQYEEK